jgi:hypothetical protein
MKKPILRVISLVIIIALVLSMTSFAAVNASEYIAITSAWITRDGDNVKVNFYIVGTNIMDKIGVKYIYLYERNGISWRLVETFDYTDPLYASAMMDTNTGAHSGLVTYSGSATKHYYADCRFYAEKDGGSDTFQQDTPTSYGTSP